jgi:hypothetical protein
MRRTRLAALLAVPIAGSLLSALSVLPAHATANAVTVYDDGNNPTDYVGNSYYNTCWDLTAAGWGYAADNNLGMTVAFYYTDGYELDRVSDGQSTSDLGGGDAAIACSGDAIAASGILSYAQIPGAHCSDSYLCVWTNTNHTGSKRVYQAADFTSGTVVFHGVLGFQVRSAKNRLSGASGGTVGFYYAANGQSGKVAVGSDASDLHTGANYPTFAELRETVVYTSNGLYLREFPIGNINSFQPNISLGSHSQPVVATAPDGKTAYVYAVQGSSKLTPVNLETRTAGSQINVSQTETRDIAITPNGATAYVAGYERVIPIDLATNTAGSAITVCTSCTVMAVAITPDGQTAYLAHGGSLTPLNVANNTLGSAITVCSCGIVEVAITPDGKTAWVTAHTANPFVTWVDLATGTVDAGMTLSTDFYPCFELHSIAIDPTGTTAYITARRAHNSTNGVCDVTDPGSVVPITLATEAVGSAITVGQNPHGIDITPASSGAYAYVSYSGGGDLTRIALPSGTTTTFNGAGHSNVAITGPLAIGNGTSLPSATQSTAYSRKLWSLYGTAPFTYAVSSGTIPPGLSLSSAGVLSGTPTTTGNYTFTVTVTDSSSTNRVGQKTFQLNVS